MHTIAFSKLSLFGFGFRVTTSCAQDFLLALCLGITPVGFEGLYVVLGFEQGSASCIQGKYQIYPCTICPNLNLSYLEAMLLNSEYTCTQITECMLLFNKIVSISLI